MAAKPICEGKRALIFGVANERSIAWGITRTLHTHGARCAITYAGDAIEKRARPLAESVDAELILPCDVLDAAQVSALFDRVAEHWGGLDILIHSIAFAHREDLDGRFMDTTRDGFLKAMEVSVFSLVDLVRHAEPMLRESGGNVLTMTYYGAEKVIPNYNVMGVAKAALESAVRYLAADLGPDGIRVNAISAGPIRTLAASGVKGFKTLMAEGERRAPLRRAVSIDEVGNAALYLCSDLGSGVTGEVLHVDSGYNVTGG
jgi:enoyl-[acyl-carrier protein] reductase I